MSRHAYYWILLQVIQAVQTARSVSVQQEEVWLPTSSLKTSASWKRETVKRKEQSRTSVQALTKLEVHIEQWETRCKRRLLLKE
jgi:hypothetical protein